MWTFFIDLWIASNIPSLNQTRRLLPANYPLVSITCNFSKIFETIISDTIFCQKYPTALLKKYDHYESGLQVTSVCNMLQTINDKLQIDVIYTDVHKVFHQIDLFFLITKLKFIVQLLQLTGSNIWNTEIINLI